MDAFDQFWAAWPKRVKRQEAIDAFRWAMAHHNGDGTLLQQMLDTIAWQSKFYGSPQYMPDPNRWLLACRWTDENPVIVRVETISAERAAEKARHAEREQRYEEWQAALKRRA